MQSGAFAAQKLLFKAQLNKVRPEAPPRSSISKACAAIQPILRRNSTQVRSPKKAQAGFLTDCDQSHQDGHLQRGPHIRSAPKDWTDEDLFFQGLSYMPQKFCSKVRLYPELRREFTQTCSCLKQCLQETFGRRVPEPLDELWEQGQSETSKS